MTEGTYRNLVRRFGSPLFIYYPDRFVANSARYKSAFRKHYPRATVAYSTKTNYLPVVVRTAISCDVVPEVIPGIELELMERIGALDRNAIVNGPLKTHDELTRIVQANARINVDNLTELEELNDIAGVYGRTVDIGLRVSGNFGEKAWLRFGFNIDDGLAQHAAGLIKNHFTNLRLVGLHIHLGTNILDLDVYRSATLKLIEIATEFRERDLIDLQYLDLGGGFATLCPFLDHDPREWVVPSADQYAQAIADPIKAAFNDDLPELIIEPGRALVDDTFELLTTVCRVRGNGHEVIMDAGQNIFSSCRFRRHGIVCVDRSADRPMNTQKWTLYGPLCMQSDCLGRDVELPELLPGDLIRVDFAGAYSLSQAWQFIRFQPAVVSVSAGSATLVRARETLDTLLARDTI